MKRGSQKSAFQIRKTNTFQCLSSKRNERKLLKLSKEESSSPRSPKQSLRHELKITTLVIYLVENSLKPSTTNLGPEAASNEHSSNIRHTILKQLNSRICSQALTERDRIVIVPPPRPLNDEPYNETWISTHEALNRTVCIHHSKNVINNRNFSRSISKA